MRKRISILILSVLIFNFLYSQENDINTLLLEAKRHYAKRNLEHFYPKDIEKSVQYLNKALLINPNHKETNELSVEINFEVALDMLEIGKRKLYKYYDSHIHADQYSNWHNGYYFYRALEHFANAYKSGLDSILVNNYIREIDSIGKAVDKTFFPFPNDSLYIISSSFQVENLEKIKSLKGIIRTIQDTVEKSILYDLYNQLICLEKLNYIDGNFQGYDYKQTRRERAKLSIELGNVDEGCLELYTIDFLDFELYLPLCNEWHNQYSAQKQKKYVEQLKLKAKQWYKDNPGKIKFLSLFGEDFETVESYLGKPTVEKYKIDIGAGWEGDQFIGNKYQNKQGIYEIGFKNGNVYSIKFTPANYLSFSMDIMKDNEETSKFDFESQIGGVCAVERSNGYIKNLKTYTINMNCNTKDQNITFYGSNGKIIYVIAFY